MAKITKCSTRLTQELAKTLVDMACVVRITEFAEGVEIHDTRSLVDRLEAPIAGAGVVRFLGDTHFILTEALANRLNAKPLLGIGAPQ